MNFNIFLSGLIFLILILFFISGCLRFQENKIRMPGQQFSGPGGSDYAYGKVIKSVYGDGAQEYWIFEPDSPRPPSAPLILFIHGWGAMNPQSYGAWIDHLVRKGNIVVYPRYQKSLRTPPQEFVPQVLSSFKSALETLRTKGSIRADVEKFAIVGHSMGGIISANVAALSSSSHLPHVKALMIIEPGKTESLIKRSTLALEDLSKISLPLFLLVVVGDEDKVVGDSDAKKIFQQTINIPLEKKNYVVVHSDRYGSLELVANHISPAAPDTDYDSGIMEKFEVDGFENVDTLDYYGYWKLFDGLTDCAFYERNCEYALGNTPEQRFMGYWSDGTPLRELTVKIII